MYISYKAVQYTAAKRTQAEMLTTSFALPRARRSKVGDSTSSSLIGSIRVVLRRADGVVARGGALDLLRMAKRVGLQYEATEYEDLSGEENFPLDRVVEDD